MLDLRTDLVAGIEFSRVRTERFEQLPSSSAAEDAAAVREVVVAFGEDLTERRRIADFTGLPPGTHAVRVRLVDRDDAIALERIALVTLNRTSVFTLQMTRDCRGKTCPGPADDPSFLACVGGRCVDPACTPETPERCDPAASCQGDEECTAEAPCAEARCIEGVCLRSAALPCGDGQWCQPETGCQPIPELMDGGQLPEDGPGDASFDAGCPADGSCKDASPTTPPAMTWGQWSATLALLDCPPGQELIVNTTSWDLEGNDTTLDDPANAGPTLSMREALWIARNRSGQDTILFDPSVFPVDSPATIVITETATLLLEDACVDGRGRGVIFDAINDGNPSSAFMPTLGTGSYLVGLTFHNTPSPLRINGGRIAGSRLYTDGKTRFGAKANVSIEMARGSTLGPGNVVIALVGLDGGGMVVRGNYVGYDPITGATFGTGTGLFARVFFFPPGLARVDGNVFFSTLNTVNSIDDRVVVEMTNNRFGVDFNGRPIPRNDGLGWAGRGTAIFGPGNIVTRVFGAAVQFSPGPAATIRITKNVLYGNAKGIEFPNGAPHAPPSIASASAAGASGNCEASGTVELYSDQADQGELFLASVPCTTGPGWSYGGPIPQGRNLTATLTIGNQTSAFSAPFAVP